ncbi:MAG: hypothetical protein ACI4SF_14025 [Oscillospiraceae bacterium]
MRYKKALAVLTLAACLSACGKSSVSENMDGANYCDADGNPITFSETVGQGYEVSTAEVSETEIIEEVTMESVGFFLPCTNGSYLLIIDNYGPTELTPEDGDYSVFAEFTAGDRVKAVHGILLETYPAMTTFSSIEKLSEGDISDIHAELLYDLEEMGWIAVSDNSDTVQTDETTAYMTPTVLDRETDRRIRSDYAAYVSARDNREITADSVRGQFYYGNDNGYMLLVMCPSDSYTDDLREYSLQIMDIPDDDCDCYPYVDVMLPSGMFEMLAYKDGIFIDIETAISEKLISYDAVSRIAEYMDLCYSEGDQMCVYKTNYIDD